MVFRPQLTDAIFNRYGQSCRYSSSPSDGRVLRFLAEIRSLVGGYAPATWYRPGARLLTDETPCTCSDGTVWIQRAELLMERDVLSRQDRGVRTVAVRRRDHSLAVYGDARVLDI